MKDTLTHIDIGDTNDVFWPARSRRGTVDESHRPTEAQMKVPQETPRSSLWDLLTDEAGAEGWDGWAVDGKWERIQEFMAVPMAVEKVGHIRPS